MKIAIIGAGFCGLSIAWELAKSGYDITIFEGSATPGGLASGFNDKKWLWTLEKHYHHLFLTDKDIFKLAKEVGQEIIVERPKTSTYSSSNINQIDSALGLLRFNDISFVSRIRTGVVIATLKLIPFIKRMERRTTKYVVRKYMGEESWKVLWEPLMDKKFGKYAKDVPFAWFWARVKTRTTKLAYPKGGFLVFANRIVMKLKNKKVTLNFGMKVESIKKTKFGFKVFYDDKSEVFDKVICTLPTNLFLKIVNWDNNKKPHSS